MATLKNIALFHGDFPQKFGIPRQSGLAAELEGHIIFEPEYRDLSALRGLEDFSHLWLIWGFSENAGAGWQPTVRPPRLGGNARMGVFATRSPYRPNPLGLSCVKLKNIETHGPCGPVIHVLGADLMDNTPIYDIKPYLPYVDSHPNALGGFARQAPKAALQVSIGQEWLALIPTEKQAALYCVLAQDPRPAYHDEPGRIYGMAFAGLNILFRIEENTAKVCGVAPL